MQWFKNKWFTHQYYKITENGDQVSMMENVSPSYILHIYNDGHLRYHFIKPGQSYKIKFSNILGLSVTYNVPYVLPTESFAIQNNEFNSIFQKWLCKHYLYIPEQDGIFTIIDQDACINICENFCVP
jgi:hypothetical protein